MKSNFIVPALVVTTLLTACSEKSLKPLAETHSCKVPPKLDAHPNSQIPIFRSYHQEAVKSKMAKIKKGLKASDNGQAENLVRSGFINLKRLSPVQAATWCNYELYNKNKCQKIKGLEARMSGQKLSYIMPGSQSARIETYFSDPNYTIVETKQYGPKISKKQSKLEERYERLEDGIIEYIHQDSYGSYKAYKEYDDCSGEFTRYRDTAKGKEYFINAKWSSTLQPDFKIKYTYCKEPGECISGVL